ncbi:acetyl esterase [Paracoccus seriniphilus]|uniref:Acetyl esterase n=2 Tax=Paracoccus seriniphilus TaxID=184748 RepID=A0A239Q1E7_9RHOB|nr:alpha/beta hydrolase fold domain-containing protein [Paracoccus seriniphilus]SNT76158.1 acetyl esterase [Paracoccus seriniphilus]
MTIAEFERRFQSGLTAMAALSLPEARRSYDRLCAGFAPDLPKGMELGDTRIAGVAVRWHRPARSAPGRVVYVHGGSFSLGSLDSHQGIAAGLAEALGHEVLSIDYRLLPEAGYAAALDDCRRVIAAVAPLALVGDSAGARLLLDVIDDPEHAPVLGLIYPLVGQPTSETLGPDAPLLSRDDVLEAWAAIAPDAPTRDALSPPASRIEVLAVSRDPLTVPLERGVSAWRSGGAEVGYHIADDMLHGCLHARESLPEMASAWMTFCQALKRRLDG